MIKSSFKYVALAVLGVMVVAAPSLATTVSDTTVTEEIAKFGKVAEGLAGLVTMFTAILITPMGISAGAKVFKTLVLYNL